MRRLEDPRIQLAAATAALLAILGPFLLADGVDVPDDALYYALPSWEWLRHAAWTGTSPWWVPGKLGGTSLFADVVPMGPFYPAVLLGLLLPSVPALVVATTLHVVGAFFATRWAARVHGASAPTATLAALGVLLGPVGAAAVIDAQFDAWPTFLWFPVVLGCLERASSEEGAARRRLLACGGAAVGLLLLGTHLRVAAAAGAALTLWALLRGKDLRGAAIVGGLGLLAGAPGFLPILSELAEAGGRGGNPLIVDQALGLGNVAGWLAPTPRVLIRDLSPGTVLAAAFVLGVGRSVAVSRTRLVIFALILLGAGASAIPGLQWVFLPLRLLSAPVDIVYAALAMYPAAIVGALALDRVCELGPDAALRRLRRAAPILGLLAAAAAARPALRLILASDAPVGTAVVGALQMAVALAAVGWIVARVPDPERRRALILAVALLDLVGFAVRAHRVIPSTPLRAPHADVSAIAGGYLDIEDLARGFDSALTAAGAEDTSRGVEWDIRLPEVDGPAMQADLLGRTWPPHLGVAAGIRGLAGRSKLAPTRQIAALTPLADQLQTVDADPDVLSALFAPDGLGTRTLLLHGVPIGVWGDRFAARADPPVCTQPTRWIVEPDPRTRVELALVAAADPSVAYVEREEDVPRSGGAATCERIPGGVRVSSGDGAVVVLPERVHRGRTVEADGQALGTFPVDQVRTGVVVPPGAHDLRLRFRPPGLAAAAIAAAIGWLSLAALGIGRRASGLALLLVLAAPAASAGELSGSVAPIEPGTEYSVLITPTLDLAAPPLATAEVGADGTWRAEWGGGAPVHVFLRQSIGLPGEPPLVFHVPYDLAPLDPRAQKGFLRLAAVPRAAAVSRAKGTPIPGWWAAPLLLVLLLYGGGAGALRLLRAPAGAPTQLGPGGVGRRSGAPRAGGEPPPPVPGERLGLGAILAAAAIARLPRLLSGPLELIEHTYGPGSRRLVPVDESGAITTPLLERLTQAVLEPASLEVTHPPLWHALLSAIGAVTDAEWALRLPSFAASLAAVVALSLLFRRLDPAAGLLAAGLYALAAPGVHPGADATPYAFVALVSVGSLELLLRALERGTDRAWRLWMGALVLGFLAHYTTAFFGLAQVVSLSVFVAMRRADPRWRAAGRGALRAVLLLAPIPLGWSFLHFASFSAVALDTRLFASVYPLDPGRLSFLTDFAIVTVGADPEGGRGAALLGFGLAGVGLWTALRRDAHLGMLLLGAAAAWAGGTFFFHGNLVQHLGGRVFYGFRWVSWFAPLVLGLGAIGVVRARRAGRLEAILGIAAGLLWTLSAFGLATRSDASPRPRYDLAAERILEELADRDAVAVLPLWGQRGPLGHYLTRGDDALLIDRDDGLAWEIGGRRVFLEAIDESLPFETTARNGHFERLWVAVIDERMFGRAKFDRAGAERALAWADRAMIPDGAWSFEGLELRRFRRAAGLWDGSELKVTSALVDVASARWLEPNAPTCTDLGLEPGDAPRWRLNVRVPMPQGAEPRARVDGGRLLDTRTRDGAWSGVVEGGPCSEAPPVLTLGSFPK